MCPTTIEGLDNGKEGCADSPNAGGSWCVEPRQCGAEGAWIGEWVEGWKLCQVFEVNLALNLGGRG